MNAIGRILLLAVALISIAQTDAQEILAPSTAKQAVVVPNGASASFGDTTFDPFFGTQEPAPVTQVYDPAEFKKGGITSSILIDSISFRVQQNLKASLDVFVPHIIFTLGMSPGLLQDYAPSRVEDRTVVYDQSSVHLRAGSPQSPSQFGLVFSLSTPYLYDPSKGSLELTISSHQSSGYLASMDAQYSSGSLYYYEPGFRPRVVSETIVTKFGVTAIPEPSPVAIILLFFGLYACLGLKLPLKSARRFDAHFESLPGVRSPVSNAQRIPHYPN